MGLFGKIKRKYRHHKIEKKADEVALKEELKKAKAQARKEWAKSEAKKRAKKRYRKKDFFEVESDLESLAKGPDIPGF